MQLKARKKTSREQQQGYHHVVLQRRSFVAHRQRIALEHGDRPREEPSPYEVNSLSSGARLDCLLVEAR